MNLPPQLLFMILILLMIPLCDRSVSLGMRIRSRRDPGTVDAALHSHAVHSTTTHGLPTKRHFPEASAPTGETPDFRMTSYVVDEINAYVAIRDIALAEAEKEPNSVNLERARIANDFVANCLKPARSPYEAQHLPETDAVRERGSCQDVNVRLALLRAHLDAMSRDHADAA